VFSLAHLQGCAWLFGHAEVPQPRDPVRPRLPIAKAQAAPLEVSAEWIGLGDRIVTARNPWGRAARVVNAFGEDSFQVRVTARAAGTEPVVLLPEKATIADDGGTPRKARTLNEFRARWPGWPVETDEQESDRKAAYEHVLGLLLIEREVQPGMETAGVLAFPAFTPRHRLILTFPYRVGFKGSELKLAWEGL
jgi:hypothetical protein